MRLVENITTFAGETSIHGLKYIAKSSSTNAKRITWTFLFVGALMYALVEISHEVKSKLTLIYKVICQAKVFTKSKTL